MTALSFLGQDLKAEQSWVIPGTRLSLSVRNQARVCLVTQMVKNLPAMQESGVRSLGWEDSPEKGMATHSSILAWRIPWIEKSGGLRSMGSQRVRNA